MQTEFKKPLSTLAIGIFMAMLPFGETPHLIQKLKLLSQGWLQKPMDWFDLLLHGTVLLYGIYLLLKVASSQFNSKNRISKEERNNMIKEMINNGAKIVDVRSSAEFAGGSFPDAINIPVDQIESRIAEFGDKDKPIIVFCASGARSNMAKNILLSKGYTTVENGGNVSSMLAQT